MNIKQIEKLKAKERSFVLRLTNKDITTLLEKCGYSLNENLYNEQTGKRLPAITKFYNEQLKEYQIQIRCIKKNCLANKIAKKITSRFPIINFDSYNSNMSIVILSDFSFSEFLLTPNENNNQLTYAKFMYNKFGEYYRTKYNKTVRKQSKENEHKQGSENAR